MGRRAVSVSFIEVYVVVRRHIRDSRWIGIIMIVDVIYVVMFLSSMCGGTLPRLSFGVYLHVVGEFPFCFLFFSSIFVFCFCFLVQLYGDCCFEL